MSNIVSEYKLEELKQLLRDENLCMIFEVNDPSRDPHMIEYDKPHAVLLDIVYRTEEFCRLSYAHIQKIANDYGLQCKRKAIIFNDWESFASWHHAIEKLGVNYSFKDKHIEGFVVEDSKNIMFKIKLPYYSFWKEMRSLKERIITIRQSGGNLKRDISNPDAKAFYEWAKQQPDEVLNMDIITLRKKFEEEKK